jgi:hypothetical protein
LLGKNKQRQAANLLVIPLLWAIGGGVMPVSIGILEDIGMIMAGVLGTALILFRDRNR